MSLTGFFFRKNITDDRFEHDAAEIEKVLHELNFEYNTSEGKEKCWYVRDGSSYIDEGRSSPR